MRLEHRVSRSLIDFQFLAVAILLLLAGFVPRPTLAVQPREQGLSFIQTFTLDKIGGASQSWGVVQGPEGLIYVANLMGVMEYDGGKWRMIYHPAKLRPISLDIDTTGRVYVGFQGDMGYLRLASNGQRQVVSLRAQMPDSIKDVGYIWATKAIGTDVYFRSPTHLYRWRRDKLDERYGQMKAWNFPEGNDLAGLSEIDGRPMFWQSHVGLMVVKGDSCVPVPGSDVLANLRTRSITRFSKDTLLLACANEGLFLFDGTQVRPFTSEANRYARKNYAASCIPVREGLFALATRYGGVILFDHQGRIHKIFDKSMGLPDNKVLGPPYVDSQGGLWLPLNYGIARIEAPSPLEYWDYGLGVDGNINTIIRHHGRLYVGTSQGLRILEPSAVPGRPSHFRMIQGTEGQCWALISVHDRLYSVSTRGLERIVSPDRPPVLVHPFRMAYCAGTSPDSSYLYLGTYNRGVYSFHWNGNGWTYEGKIDGTSQQVLQVEVDPVGDLWLMAEYRHVEKVHFLPESRTAPREHTVAVYDTSRGLPKLSHYYPIVLNKQLYVGSPAGLFRYDPGQDMFVPDSILGDVFGSGERGTWNMVVDAGGRVWFNSQFAKGARVTPGEQGSYELNYPLLRASQSNFLCFYPENDGKVLWAGAESGRLIRYNESYQLPDTLSYKALVRRVVAGRDSILMDGSEPSTWETPRLPFSMNSMRFEFTIPRYDAPEGNKYQYRLVGLNNTWSEWTRETYRNFNSLHEGHYRFEVRGHDVYYIESKVGSLDFVILPPWYRTIWAYIAYILVFFALIYLLVKLRVRRIEAQKRHLEQLVSQRTDELAQANDKVREYSEHLEVMLEERTRHLIRSERQAVFGQMVQGIVHNLKNPLTSSSMSTQLIRLALDKLQNEDLDDEEEVGKLRELAESVSKMVGWIEKANDTLNNMISSLLTKSRSDKERNMKTLNLNDLIGNELEFLQADRMFKDKVKKNFNLSTEPLPVKVVPGELAQAFQNLVRNALDAMYHTPKPELEIRTVRQDNSAVLMIADNGSGIPKDIQERIFDPFFSTKPAESDTNISTDEPKGTGLGLWMVQETVQSFNGGIEVKSTQGVGTTFTITLPLGEDEEEDEPDDQPLIAKP